MKLPRDIDGAQLVKALRLLGYEVTRQTGPHIRVTTPLNGENHEVIPNHTPLKIGTLAGILKHLAMHHQKTLEELLQTLDL